MLLTLNYLYKTLGEDIDEDAVLSIENNDDIIKNDELEDENEKMNKYKVMRLKKFLMMKYYLMKI